MKRRTLTALILTILVALCSTGARVPALATDTEAKFSYEHSPLYNPKAMADIIENPDAVYGFSPRPDSGSLSSYAAYDWTDPDVVALAHENRWAYLQEDQRIYDLAMSMVNEGTGIEEIARKASALRNQIRLESYRNDPEGLAMVKARNLEKYGNEDGPTPESLYEKYGTWEAVLDNSFNTNPGMDACCGFYDYNYEKYIWFGQIPKCTVSFDAAGHGEAPVGQSVYAGEFAQEPEDPAATGWKFLGWHTEGSTEAFDFSAPIAADTVLLAMWADESDTEPEPEPDPTPEEEKDTEEKDPEPTPEQEQESEEKDPKPTQEQEQKTEEKDPEPKPTPTPASGQGSGSGTSTPAAPTQQPIAASRATPVSSAPLATVVSRASSTTASALPKVADPTDASLAASLFLAGSSLLGGHAARRRRAVKASPHRSRNRNPQTPTTKAGHE